VGPRRTFHLTLIALATISLLAAGEASAAQRIATARGHVAGSPQLVGAGVAWQQVVCIRNCADVVSCPPEG
jgi:hypothetical protein